jgi:hypothetical protein
MMRPRIPILAFILSLKYPPNPGQRDHPAKDGGNGGSGFSGLGRIHPEVKGGGVCSW